MHKVRALKTLNSRVSDWIVKFSSKMRRKIQSISLLNIQSTSVRARLREEIGQYLLEM